MGRLKICWKTRFWGPFLHLRSRSSRFSSMKWSHEPQFWSFGSFSPVLVNTLFEVDTVNGTVSHQWESWVQLYCFASKVSQKTRKQDWVRVRFVLTKKTQLTETTGSRFFRVGSSHSAEPERPVTKCYCWTFVVHWVTDLFFKVLQAGLRTCSLLQLVNSRSRSVRSCSIVKRNKKTTFQNSVAN